MATNDLYYAKKYLEAKKAWELIQTEYTEVKTRYEKLRKAYQDNRSYFVGRLANETIDELAIADLQEDIAATYTEST